MIDLIYIASPSFSGSTILTFILGAHRSIATIGELKWGEIEIDTYPCSCGALLRQCEFWKTVQSRMKALGLPIDLKRPPTDFRFRDDPWVDHLVRARVRGPVFETFRDALVTVLPPCRRSWGGIDQVNRAMMEIIVDLKSASMFLDASKDPVRLKHLMACDSYRVWLIQLIRDGRAVMNSAMKNEGKTPEQGALEWLRTHRQIERLATQLDSGRVLRLRYEDLCLKHDATCHKIFNFLELDPSDAVADFRSVDHHILGNKMRLQPGSEVRLDEKWKDMLSPADLATFDRVAGDLNRQYGYSL